VSREQPTDAFSLPRTSPLETRDGPR
jgi:hypothetical protein